MSDVFVCPPEHKHAEVGTCYVQHKCRCGDCRAGNSRRERWRTRQKAYGRYDNGLVDAAPVREHVLMLRASGLGYKTIAHRAGVSVTGVRALIYGREDYVDGGHGPRHGEQLQRVARAKAERILALEPSIEYLGERIPVPAWPYVRRVRALVAMGWSMSAVARALGSSASNFRMLREYERASHKNRVMIRASTARAIVALYEEWSNVRPPEGTHRERIVATRARRYAAERGWPVPMDWEAVDNDFDRPAPVRRSAA